MPEHIQELSSDHIEKLKKIVGAEHLSTKGADLDQHAKDQSFHPAHRPAAVVWPETAQEISEILKYANENLIPVTAWGAGTSIEGNPIPVYGGIVLNTSRMDKIIEVHPEDFQVDVQPGVRYKDMNEQLSKHGLFYAPDPGANASIGGMIANNAAGTRTPRYGATKDNVLRLEVVLANGEIIETGTRAAKTSSGYDLVHMFIGSEGTLGIVTQATLRLAPLPEKFSAAVASFNTAEDAARAVSGIMGSGIVPAALEFLDAQSVALLNTADEFDLPVAPTLIMEFHSATDAGLKAELEMVQEICEDEKCVHFESGVGRANRDRLWKTRHQAYEIMVRNNPGVAFLVLDIAVPVSKYPDLVKKCRQVLDSAGLSGYMVGHAGDGNLHPLAPYTPDDEASYKTALDVNRQIIEAAIEMGGTATGEHGVGLGKREYMVTEHGASLKTMQAIKQALDPNGILNPGKIFSEQ